MFDDWRKTVSDIWKSLKKGMQENQMEILEQRNTATNKKLLNSGKGTEKIISKLEIKKPNIHVIGVPEREKRG